MRKIYTLIKKESDTRKYRTVCLENKYKNKTHNKIHLDKLNPSECRILPISLLQEKKFCLLKLINIR
jgi:hypothetical protein